MAESAKKLWLITLVFLCLIILEVTWWHSLQGLENKLSDSFVRQQAQNLPPDPEIMIVDIDDSSLARMQSVAGNWPWPRSVHGELINGVAAQGPAAIVFDVVFSEKDQYRPESDQLLNDALGNIESKVYFPIVRRDAVLDVQGAPLGKIAPLLKFVATDKADPEARIAVLPPLAIDTKYWHVGTINYVADDDGVGRRYQLFTPAYGWLIPSLPARVATDLGYKVPQQADMLLAWRGKAGAFKHISYVDLYEDFNRESPLRPKNELAGKIMIIGTAASGLHDFRVTPIGNTYPGIEILATALDNLKNQRMQQAAPPGFKPGLVLLLIALLGAGFMRGINAMKMGVALAVITVLILSGSYFAAGHLYLVPVLLPLLAAWGYYFTCALQAYLRERKSREQAVQLFSRFVNPHVVQELIAHGGLSRAGESRQITILFSDIRGFTAISEKRTPQEVVALLNRYFSLQVEVIFRHGGSLDKFIGDCIMAFWGAPLDDPKHAQNAVAAALEMGEVLQRFKTELGETDVDFDVGIGIHSGSAVVGLIGSEQRREYTAIGDTVNLGSRIEGLTKGIAGILVSKETRALCGDEFYFQSVGLYQVKGREQDVELFVPHRRKV